MKTTVSARGQTVVPQEIREKMGSVPQTELEWQIRDGVIVVYTIPPDPIQAAVGLLKGQGPTTDDLLAERQRERQREQGREED
jgi:bifunctional DNA-binding transcriptional regulator/antitoxin component of YhaV-PrlF toxin-antitoxin module